MVEIGASSATIDMPIEHLMACHRRIEQRLDTLVRAAGHLEEDRAAALEAIQKSLAFLDSSGVQHTEDEEASLFPRLRARLTPDQIAYLDSLEAQHVRAEGILCRLKQLVHSGHFEQYRACAEELRSLYREHIRSEDTILTALAKQSISESELMEISREMRVRRGL